MMKPQEMLAALQALSMTARKLKLRGKPLGSTANLVTVEFIVTRQEWLAAVPPKTKPGVEAVPDE